MVFIREIIYIKIKNGTYLVNLDEYELVGNHWIALYTNVHNATYFIATYFGKKYIMTIIYRIQANDSVMWRYFCIGFIGFMLKSKCLLDYVNLFSPNEYEKNRNYKINTKTFSITKKLKMNKKIALLVVSIKAISFSIISGKCENEEEKYLKKKNRLRY